MAYDLFIALSSRALLTYQNNFFKQRSRKKILISYDNKLLDTSKWDIVVSLGKPMFNKASSTIESFVSVFKTVLAYKKALVSVKKIINTHNLSVYYPTLEDVLCNYLFFYFKNTDSFFVVEEGTLNYYHHSTANLSFKKKIVKKLIALSFGLNYNPFYKGHTTGIDYDKVKNSYVIEPKLAYNSPKAKKIKLTNEKSPKLEPSALIIGQEPYKALLGESQYNKIIDIFFKNINIQLESSHITKIFYKSHRYGPRIEKKILVDYFKNFEVNYIDSEESIEIMYFNSMKAQYIFTLDSSALLSIYFSCSETTKKQLKLFSFSVNPKTRTLFRSISKDLNDDF